MLVSGPNASEFPQPCSLSPGNWTPFPSNGKQAGSRSCWQPQLLKGGGAAGGARRRGPRPGVEHGLRVGAMRLKRADWWRAVWQSMAPTPSTSRTLFSVAEGSTSGHVRAPLLTPPDSSHPRIPLPTYSPAADARACKCDAPRPIREGGEKHLYSLQQLQTICVPPWRRHLGAGSVLRVEDGRCMQPAGGRTWGEGSRVDVTNDDP